MGSLIDDRGSGRRPRSLTMWLLPITVIAVAAIVIAVAGRGQWTGSGEPVGTATEPRSSAVVGEASSSDGASLEPGAEATGLPVLLDLGAGTCVPCKMMAPILEEMRETFEGQLAVRFIDVWKNAEAGRRYGVRVIPTQIFFDEDGDELFRHQGFLSREEMLGKWKELGYEFEG